jgi:hypothetical protein
MWIKNSQDWGKHSHSFQFPDDYGGDLGGLVVSVLAGSIPTEIGGFLRVIKIRSTTSFGGEVKPSVSCRRFTACKRNLRAWIEMFRKQNLTAISHPSLQTACQMALEVKLGLSWTARPVGWSPNCHKCADHVTSERGSQAHIGLSSNGYFYTPSVI